jgi:hypothetical protein
VTPDKAAIERWTRRTLKGLLGLAAAMFVWIWVIGVPLLYADVAHNP